MLKNPVQIVKAVTTFDPTTFDVIWPLGNPCWFEFLWARLTLAIDVTVLVHRKYSLQFLDPLNNVVYEAFLADMVPSSPSFPVTITIGMLPSVMAGLNPQQESVTPEVLLQPGSAFRIYDTGGQTVATDTAKLHAALFNT